MRKSRPGRSPAAGRRAPRCPWALANIESIGYAKEAVEQLPGDVLSANAGCGNPIADAHPKPGETVLDLGSGAGLDCFLAAKEVGPHGSVIGLDMTDAMLEKAEKNRQSLGVHNVSFRKGEMENMPIEDEAVDIIISNCVINLSPDKAAVFRESFRVLRGGGRFVVSDVIRVSRTRRRRANRASWRSIHRGLVRVHRGRHPRRRVYRRAARGGFRRRGNHQPKALRRPGTGECDHPGRQALSFPAFGDAEILKIHRIHPVSLHRPDDLHH